MQRSPFTIPTWAPAVAAVGLVAWAVSIWWMVATLPTAGDTSAFEESLDAIAAEMATLHEDLSTLAVEVDTLRAEREALATRLDSLESRGALGGAFELSTGDTPADEADGEVAAEPHPLFTDGTDRYNCRHFASHQEAQEALRVNRPGDPNRIDMNDNGVACEDFRYPAPPASPASTQP